jgi:hypothetical protein
MVIGCIEGGEFIDYVNGFSRISVLPGMGWLKTNMLSFSEYYKTPSF